MYSQVGTYSVKATFSDGYSSTSSSVSVDIKYFFSFSFCVGMKWQFSYLYENVPFMGDQIVQSGIHKWQVTSISLINQDSIYTVQQIRKDTVEFSNPGENVDTTYIIADTSEFIIQYFE